MERCVVDNCFIDQDGYVLLRTARHKLQQNILRGEDSRGILWIGEKDGVMNSLGEGIGQMRDVVFEVGICSKGMWFYLHGSLSKASTIFYECRYGNEAASYLERGQC